MPRPKNYRRMHPTRRSPSRVRDPNVEAAQTEMNQFLRHMFGPEDPAQPAEVALNVDGIRGPATNGTEQAINRFLDAMLNGAVPPVAPGATMSEKAARLGKILTAANAPDANPEQAQALKARLEAARTTARTEITAIGTPRHGFTRQFSVNAPPVTIRPSDAPPHAPLSSDLVMHRVLPAPVPAHAVPKTTDDFGPN